MNLAALAEPFPATDIEWRIGQAGKRGDKIWAKVLAYITNRAIMDRLDKVCGPQNWKNEFRRDGNAVMCGLSVKIGDEWVTKWDGAEDTDIEAVKGGLSGAMKRAGVQWGIGRYLYDLEEGWADVCENGMHYVGKNDKKDLPAFKWNPPNLPKWALPGDVVRETVARGAGSLPYLANGVTTPPAQASEKEGASPAPPPKGGFDLVKKEKLSQKNIDLLLKKAAPRFGTGAETGLLICVFEATGVRPASLKSSDWPPMDVQQYDKILEAIKAPEMPDAVKIEDMETELLARLKDMTLKPKVRVAVLAEYENARDKDILTVEGLQEWLGALAFAKQD